MTRRRSRRLTADELQLWALVARGVTPLKGRTAPVEADHALDAPQAPTPANGTSQNEPQTSPLRGPPKIPPLVPLERKAVTALRRGRRDIEAVIDLHGMRQSEAHEALRAFLRRAQGAGQKLVLVITGKGAAGAEHAVFEERGVLRRVVPHWLRLPDLRPFVLGFEEAAPHHGGSGALYVRLRRATQRGE